MREIIGGCLCGQVRYSVKADPAFVGVCHCKNCQKQTGTSFSVLIGVPKSALSIRGKIRTFHDSGDSGQAVDRNFCPECGSPIFSEAAVMSDVAFIKAGTIDDTSWLAPTVHIYCDSRQSWIPIPEGNRQFPKMP
jgi:hypothetical protein